MFGLDDVFGPDNAARLSDAYQAILQSVAERQPKRTVDHDTRLTIVTSLLAEARRGVFDPECLRAAGLGVV